MSYRGESHGRGFDRNYRRGAIMGLTVAEAFILLCFCLLLLFTWWQADIQKRSLIATKEIGNLNDQQKQAVLLGLTDGTFDAASKLRKAGFQLSDTASISDTADYSRFMREDELKRLLKSAVKLDPDTRLDLATAVELSNEDALRVALTQLLQQSNTTSKIADRLGRAAEEQKRLVQTLNSKLGDQIQAAGGSIDANGTITLPQDVLFAVNSVAIKSPALVRDLCSGWLSSLHAANVDISELRIEGHASSEGPPGSTPDQAYLSNLDLSQRRAQSALKICLDGAPSADLRWAREHLAAIGYSSAHPILNTDGSENRSRSRRVMFSVGLDRSGLINDIKKDITASAPNTKAYNRDAFGEGWADENHDCKDTRTELLAKLATGPVTYNPSGCTVVHGRWNDPYTGRIFTEAHDLDIDHLVPLAYAWARGAEQWTEARRETFANDERNLFAVSASANRTKGAMGPIDWLPENKDFRCEYINRFQRIVLLYGIDQPKAEKDTISELRYANCNIK